MEAITATRPALASELVQLAATGDAAAFTQIVAAHHGDMVRVCLAVCGDQGTSEEAAQSAWALAWRRLPGLRDTDRLRPWLASIAANQARDAVRRQRRRPIVELDMAHAGGVDPGTRAGDIDLRNALAKLDPTDAPFHATTVAALELVSGKLTILATDVLAYDMRP